MLEYKIFFALVASAFEIIANFPYILDILARKTTPHFFTWLIWTLLTWISFFILVSEGAGTGALVTGVTAVTCLGILTLSLFYGARKITTSDWICLILAFFALALWKITNNGFLAIIIIVIVDTLGFIPTFRKSFLEPYKETLSTYLLVTCKHLLTLFALQMYTPTTILYPAILFLTNFLFVIMLIIRRKKIVV
ncbi:MAG: conserved rane protein of unknown function [Candidatus Nomurabacteria bacterium]|nr:conserved rane protein of unknown function [Candidatus Nomurabacteria bacterium]